MVAGVITPGLAVPVLLCSLAVAVLLITVLLLCAEKEKGEISSEAHLNSVRSPDAKASFEQTEVFVEEETGEVTKRQSNGSAVTESGQRNSSGSKGSGGQRGSSRSSQRESAHQSNGVIENKDRSGSAKISTVEQKADEERNTEIKPEASPGASVEPEAEDGDDDYDHIQRKTFHPKMTTNPYDKVKKGTDSNMVEASDPYAHVKLHGEDNQADPSNDCDEDYAIVESPTIPEAGAGFSDQFTTVTQNPPTSLKESSPVDEDQDYDGTYAVVDKNKMSDARPKSPTKVVDEEEYYAVIPPPPVPEKNFDLESPATATTSSQGAFDGASMLPRAGNTPPIRPPDPDPPYSAITARESLESIHQRKSEAASRIIEEDYYSVVAGESGNGTVTALEKRESTSSDLYDEISGGVAGSSGDGLVAPPPVDVGHLKRLASSSRHDNQAAANQVVDQVGQLYAEVHKPNGRNPDPASHHVQSVNSRHKAEEPAPSSTRQTVRRQCYEEINLDDVDINGVDSEEDTDPNYDTVMKSVDSSSGEMSQSTGVTRVHVGGASVLDSQVAERSGDLVTTIHIGQEEGGAPVWVHKKRPHMYEEIDTTDKDSSSSTHCDMVAKI